jgi:hypothetical protein
MAYIRNLAKRMVAFDLPALGTQTHRGGTYQLDPMSGLRGLRLHTRELPQSVTLAACSTHRLSRAEAIAEGSAIDGDGQGHLVCGRWVASRWDFEPPLQGEKRREKRASVGHAFEPVPRRHESHPTIVRAKAAATRTETRHPVAHTNGTTSRLGASMCRVQV